VVRKTCVRKTRSSFVTGIEFFDSQSKSWLRRLLIERRVSSSKGKWGFALAFVKPAHIPACQHSAISPNTGRFYEAWGEESLSQYWGEHKY